MFPSAEWISRAVQIVAINLVLSGDNAVVVGMAAHSLPPRQRRIALAVGGGGAVVLRILLTGVAALLLSLSGVRAVGGALLLWIAFNLLERHLSRRPRRRSATLHVERQHPATCHIRDRH